ncbi:anaerobic ribonucleoside-triphosphate reductase activating protein [Flaviflexus sp.]|uniref:anaerobic ribonucleoside-triphosphate reductase activating protein n=1 Tax=Flaviflexus sp. TaxID=1969482 RepID=UPI003F93C51F
MSVSVATDLSIAGHVPLSTVDWPGKLVSTVFLQGCPWACGYCQNTEILDPKTPGVVHWGDVVKHLDNRRGLLDGVVFTGGEALRQEALGHAIDDVKARGFLVGVHTAGPYPSRLERFIDRIDWVGLDIKALVDDYRSVVGYDQGARSWKCLDIVLESGVDYEIRTTVHPGSPAAVQFPELLSRLKEKGVTSFALQEARAIGTSETFQREAQAWDLMEWSKEFAGLAELATTAGFNSVEIRAA